MLKNAEEKPTKKIKTPGCVTGLKGVFGLQNMKILCESTTITLPNSYLHLRTAIRTFLALELYALQMWYQEFCTDSEAAFANLRINYYYLSLSVLILKNEFLSY